MAGRGIVIRIEGDGESARQALAMVREQMVQTADESKHSAGILSKAWEEAKRAFDWVVVYEAMRKVLDAFVDLTKESIEFGEALEQASEKTGLSIQTLSVLRYAAGALHTDFETLTTGLGRMGRNIADAASGDKQLADDFKAMGLNASELATRTDGTEIAFHKLLQTIAATSSASARNKLVMDMLGRAGLDQIPVLIDLANHWDEYAQRAQAAGVVVSDQMAESLDKLQGQFNDLREQVRGAGLDFTEGLVPGLTEMMQVFSDGQSDRDTFLQWGRDLTRELAVLASVIYSAASGAESLFAITEAGSLTKIGARDLAAAKELAKQADEFRSISLGEPSDVQGPDALSNWEKTQFNWKLQNPSGAFVPPPETTGKKSPRYSDHIAEQATDLAEEQARAESEAQKAADAAALADLEAHHKEMLGSEQQYLADKLKMQTGEIDAEMGALKQQEATLEARYQKQHSDKRLKRDKDGNSAEELATLRRLEQTWEQMDAAAARYKETVASSGAALAEAKQAADLGNLRAAAELEKQQNSGITAQIALLEKETDLEAKKAAYAGESAAAQADIRANGQILEQKLRIADVDRQIQQVEEEFAAQAKVIQDKADKNPRDRLEAERQSNALHQQEVAVLQSLVQQYDALAATLGGPFTAKAQELHAALAELATPDKSKEPQYGKVLSQGITKMADTLVSQTIRGKEAFHQMAKEMETDAAELAMKLMMMKLFGNGQQGSGIGAGGGGGSGADGALGSMFSALFKDLPHFAEGGSPDSASIVGEKGPELWTPPAKGGTITPNGMLTKLAESGSGGGRGMNVTTNIVNQSSQPVTSKGSEVSYDSQAKQFVIQTILEDHATGGPIAQSMRGMTSS